MASSLTIDRGSRRYADVARWIGCACAVLILHMGVSLAVLSNLDTVPAPAAPPAVEIIDLPIEAILPEAQSVESIAAEEVAEVDPSEVVEASPVAPDETLEVEKEPPEEAVETSPKIVEAVPPTEASEHAVVMAELVKPAETVTAEPVEKPKPKPQKKPKVAKHKASNAANNSRAAAGAGRSSSKALDRYKSLVRAKILRYRQGLPAGVYGRATVRLTIVRSGALSRVRIARSSGNPVIDRTVLAIVRSAGSVPPIPAEIGRSSILMEIPFSYQAR